MASRSLPFHDYDLLSTPTHVLPIYGSSENCPSNPPSNRRGIQITRRAFRGPMQYLFRLHSHKHNSKFCPVCNGFMVTRNRMSSQLVCVLSSAFGATISIMRPQDKAPCHT
eukprot:689676-Amphidinium_carterae.1